MTSIMLNVTGARTRAEVNGPLTSGMVGIPVTIRYDDSWNGLTKNLVCRCGQWGPEKGETRTVLSIGETATVAHEVMKADMHLYLGIEGYNTDGKLVMPTTWADCGKIQHGANAGADPSTAPTRSAWAQLQGEIEQIKQNSVTDWKISAAVADYLEQHPIEVPDSSQNVNGVSHVLNSWKDKKWYVLGDSISAEASIGTGHTTKLYHSFVGSLLGFSEVVNLAQSGSTVAENDNSPKSMIDQLASVGDDADLITIFAGVNDRWFNTPMGTNTDTDTTTFYGAMNMLCQSLHENHSNALVVFITPTEQNNASCNGANTTGCTCRDLADAMIEVCEKYSIDYYDANRRSGIYPQIAANGTRYTSDSLHLNYNGHKRLADNLVSFLLGRGNTTVAAESIAVSPTSVEFTAISGYKSLSVDVTPDTATDGVEYSSSDVTVATVNGYGAVFPKGEGECDITVSCGAVSAVCHVVVNTSDGESGGEDSDDDTHTHSYSSAVTTAATCTTAGVKTYTCACGDSYTESIPATGHNYVDGACTVCGAVDPDYEENVTDPVSEHVGKTWTFTAQKWSGEVYIAALLDGSEISNDDTLEASYILSGLNNCSIHTSNTLRATNTTFTTVGNSTTASGGACYMPTANTSEDSGMVTVSGSGGCYNRDGTNLILTLRLATTALPASFKLESVTIKVNGNDAPVMDFGAYMSADIYMLT